MAKSKEQYASLWSTWSYYIIVFLLIFIYYRNLYIHRQGQRYKNQEKKERTEDFNIGSVECLSNLYWT